jgi:hypothetical protein
MHVQADRSKPLLDPATGRPTGRFERQTFDAGNGTGKAVFVESDVDLVAKFGPQKFEAQGGESAAQAARIDELEKELAAMKAQRPAAQSASAVAPGGQISTGLQGGQPSGAAHDEFDAWTVNDLRDHAASEEIDLKGARTKEEILKAIRAQARPS